LSDFAIRAKVVPPCCISTTISASAARSFTERRFGEDAACCTAHRIAGREDRDGTRPAKRPPAWCTAALRAFSSEVDIGSREENASKKKLELGS
jgi:hypothetical protein